MSLPVFKTLGKLQADMSDRLGYGNQGANTGLIANNIVNILQMAQYQLYWMFDWRYLLRTFDQPCGVGQRFYDAPADLDPMQLQSMVTEEMDGQGADHVVNGGFSYNTLGWTNSSTGTGSISWNALGYLDLNDTSAGEGIADQQLAGIDALEEYTLTFEVKDYGANGPLIKIGTALGLSDILLTSTSFAVGAHSIDFLPTVANPFLRLEASGANTNDTVSVKNISVRKKSSGSADGKIWPMKEGIDWQHDSYRNTNNRPLRYEIRDQVEVWPPADRTTYTLRYEYVRKLQPFSIASDRATIDDNVIFLHALATAKGHYGQKDFNLVLSQADTLINRLRSKNHGNRRYIRNNPHAKRYRLEHDDDYCNLIHRNILDV